MSDSILQRVADELAIRGLITRVSTLGDYGDLDEYQSLYTEDAVWRMEAIAGQPETPPTRGAAAIRAASQARRDQGATGPGSHKAHVTVVNRVTLDGDTATAESYMTFYTDTDTKPQVGVFVIYKNAFVRTPQGWKLSVRVVERL